MSISFGGLGIMSLRRSFAEWSDIVHGKGEVRSLFFALLVFVVVLVLAYLTNPSENTFRTFLTEQSFRQHLSRLDYANDDDQSDLEDIRDSYSLIRRGGPLRSGKDTLNGGGPPFHFANRASVSLRTPKHVFHSLGVCTIAAVIPYPSANHGAICAHGGDQDGSSILDSWFIGAFGKWWRAGAIEAWYRDVVVRAKDEEGWSSGILGFKALDKFNEYNSFSLSKAIPQLRQPIRGSPPKLRNRERSSTQRPGGLPPRSSTPPPLPKSASLPLHATRLPSSSTPDHRHAQVDRSTGHSTNSQPVLPSTGSPMISRSSSVMPEQSPIIAEVLRQISLSKTTVHDLRTQLTEFQSASSQSHTSLQGEVDSYRERRRQEEASRAELKSRTKNLEDSKRHAEGHKRDAEKRLKVAQNARDDCTSRMDHLDREVTRLHERATDDETATQQSKLDTANAELEISEALEQKRQEIKVAEEIITALNTRAKELEDSLASEKDRLREVRERAEIRKQDRSFFPFHVVNTDPHSTWSPIAYGPHNDPQHERHDSITHQEPDIVNGTDARDVSTSPVLRPGRLSLNGISNFNGKTSDTGHVALRSKGYSIFDNDIASLKAQRTNFSPFDETDSPVQNHGNVASPTSTSLITNGLMSVMDNSNELLTARSFQSESDAFMDKDWRGQNILRSPPSVEQQSGTTTASPISMNEPSSSEYDSFEVRHPDGMRSENMGMQRANMPVPARTYSDPTANVQAEEASGIDKTAPRRWFSTSNKPKKGLNPDAKVFQLPKNPADFGHIGAPVASNVTFDALNPNGLGSGMMAASSSNTSSLLRAFAPSPAEREVLQRAFGGSTNASLERLPSLGSIPSSPSHVHAAPARNSRPTSLHMEKGEFGRNLPSWLQNLPRIGKSNFSPWDDEEPSETASRGAGSSGSGSRR